MESAIRLCYCPLPRAPLRLSYGSKGFEDARTSIFHLRFNHASTLCVPNFSTTHPISRSSSHANCMLNRFSVPNPQHEEGGDNKILRGMSGVSLALACVLGLLNFSSRMNPKFNTAYAAQLPAELEFRIEGGGEAALESLLKMIRAEHSNRTRPRIDRRPDEAKVDELKLYAIGLSKSGEKGEKEALRILEREYNRYKNDPEPEHNLGTALVQLHIFQGNFEEARKRLDRQIDQQLSYEGYSPKMFNDEKKIEKLVECYESAHTEKHSIAQILLYKAIVHTMLKHKEAARWWEAFTQTLHANE